MGCSNDEKAIAEDALWVADCVSPSWRRLISGLVLLELMRMATLGALHLLAGHASITLHVQNVRAWAVVGPFLVLMALVPFGRPICWHRPAGDFAGG